MKKGEPKGDNKVDCKKRLSTSAIRMLPDLEIESAKGEGDRVAVVRA